MFGRATITLGIGPHSSWWRSGDITRMQDVSEYVLLLALCLVVVSEQARFVMWLGTHAPAHGREAVWMCHL